MSRPDFSALREDVLAFKAEHGEGAYRALAERIPDGPSDEAIRLFAEGKTKAPRFAEALIAALGGRTAEPDIAEEAEQALRLIKQGQERLARVAQRLRQLPADDDTARSIAARDKPMPSEQQDAPKAKRTRGSAG